VGLGEVLRSSAGADSLRMTPLWSLPGFCGEGSGSSSACGAKDVLSLFSHADSGDGLQQELGEIAEGDSVFAGDVSLGHEEKGLGEGAIDAGGGGEVGAKRFERRCVSYALGAAFLFRGVMGAELGRRDFFILNRRKLILLVDFRRITTLASIGKGELATRSGSFRRGPSLRFVAQDADPGRIGEFVRRLVGGHF
jgi:hypothetical protein